MEQSGKQFVVPVYAYNFSDGLFNGMAVYAPFVTPNGNIMYLSFSYSEGNITMTLSDTTKGVSCRKLIAVGVM